MAVPRQAPGRAAAARLAAAAAGSAILLLSACAGADNTRPAPAAPLPATAGAAPAEPSVAALPSPAAPVKPPSDVQKLIGLQGDALRQWMGKTVFMRHDGIAEIWRFAADTCFLDVFLYRERDGLRVAHLDARSRKGNQVILPQTCYGRILADRQPPPS